MVSLRALFIALFYSSPVLVSALIPTPTLKERRGIEAFIPSLTLSKRTDPTFPPSPPSCPICEQSFPSISNCASAAPVLANFSLILFNPSAFISVIECSCTDTFQSAYPQCVDCFQQTNQTDVLVSQGDQLPSILKGLKNVCAVASVLLGNVTGSNGEQVNGTPITVPPASNAIAAAPSLHLMIILSLTMAATLGLVGCVISW